ncbi:uncharacterized protein [Ptychodera flava]|uniref:uncharacterized protein n=1 Tax=Ptychodera flava TaxID=63121 RepID=UPI00396A1D9C
MSAVLFVITVPAEVPAGKETVNSHEDGLQSEEERLKDFLDVKPIHEVLEELLRGLGISNAVWTKGNGFYQVIFTCKGPLYCETILNKLTSVGIGKQANSSICVVPASIYFGQETETSVGSESENVQEEDAAMVTDPSSKQSSFLKSIKSRMTVAQVVETVQAAGELTFDYVLLIILASIIAAIGLSENSSVILVASMLISPLMGPILAGTFGTVIAHNKLRNLGIKTELIGLVLCIACGFIIGLILGSWGDQFGWPTEAMSSRGELRGLVVGVFIALPSGAAVAISVLGGNIGSLVGVAISASLLPPAVNAGMLWAYSIYKIPEIGYVEPTETIDTLVTYDPVNSTLVLNATSQNSSGMEYVNPAVEHFISGTISLVLTLLNIVCIFIVSILVLKIKEVAPHTSSAMTSQFWKKDIKVARSYYQTIENQHQGQLLGKVFFEEWQKLNRDEGSGTQTVKGMEAAVLASRFQHLVEKIEGDKIYQHIMKELPKSQQVSRHLPSEWLEDSADSSLHPMVSFHTPSSSVHYQKSPKTSKHRNLDEDVP